MAALTRAEAAHLLRRTGFGVRAADLAVLTGMELTLAVDRVLDVSANPPDLPPLALVDPQQSEWQRWVASTHWWLDRMATVPAPIQEKLTLFFHGHFTSAQNKVYAMDLMVRQNRLYRGLALGSYRDLVQAMAVEPAMLSYLDNASNRVGREQENFAREVLELFTMGVGTYQESDVVAMAKAWTGHGTTDQGRTYLFRPSWHDGSQKALFGITRAWDGPAALDEVLTGSQAVVSSRWLVTKLWSFLAFPNPPASLVDELAAGFRASGLSIHALVRAILLRPEFFSAQARDGLVRSPIELVAAGLQATGLTAAEAHPEWWFERLGQVPFNPPNVSGWRQNGAWISTAGAWARADLAGYVRWRARELRNLFGGFERLAPEVAVQRAFDTFGITEPSPTTRAALETFFRSEKAAGRSWNIAPQLVLLLLLTPDFQMA